ncbi:hypothetical protein M404DRAFT_27013 [Pisolithus tinctorius Marx 270]|uniref:Uncharacterized protein n=1 Tax=Pisolithus tinctorius Marx 270 TaxID=870435 RepID=A0A0C3J2S8_PISTI|nr:hypothetical protein M404DRAFT_27013 [Pisolithus tinctorius Marx 270]
MSDSGYESDISYDSLSSLSSPDIWSDFTNRHTSPVPVDHAEGWQRKTLPLELVEQIFDLLFLEAKTFEDIRPFSMASTQFRTVALRRYMSTLRIYSKKQLISHTLMHYSITFRSSPHVYAGFDWVKHLFVVPEALTTSRWKPDLFRDLRSLHISLADSGSRTQGSILNRISGNPTFATVASRLSSLTITSLWRIGVDLLSMVAGIFPALTDLHLSSSENLDTSCCWLCYEESSAAVTHSPIPGHYANVRTLSTAFAEALLPLTKLVHLHLGIFLSDEDMVDAHIDHYDSPREYERALLVYAAEKRPNEPVTTLSQSERSNGESEESLSYRTDGEDLEDELDHRRDGEILPFPHGPGDCPICAVLVSASQQTVHHSTRKRWRREDDDNVCASRQREG